MITPVSLIERNKILVLQSEESKRVKVWLPAPSFLPLHPEQTDGTAAAEEVAGGNAAVVTVSETAAEQLTRRTRDFNVATRERPEDLQLWLDFSAFQDTALAGCTLHLHHPLVMATPLGGETLSELCPVFISLGPENLNRKLTETMCGAMYDAIPLQLLWIGLEGLSHCDFLDAVSKGMCVAVV